MSPADRLILALPSKGRLQEQALEYFADCGLSVRKTGGERGYSADMPGAADVDVRLMSASEIAGALQAGSIHLGVTGEDLLRETVGALDGVIGLIKPLGFGFADLVVAAPQGWVDVTTMADLDEVCVAHRARTGRRLRAATKYRTLTRRFFADHEISDYRIVDSLGATEGTPAAGVAEVIVDIKTTGRTLAANHLKILNDGVILKSQAQLAAALTAPWSAPVLSALERLLDVIEALARARRGQTIQARAPETQPQQTIVETLISDAAITTIDAGAVSGRLTLFCPTAGLATACRALEQAGLGPVLAQDARYVFASPNPLWRAFRVAAGETA
ncbi:MAG: ATP phosphoribosyltransferase [Maricaulaceae bacterium]